LSGEVGELDCRGEVTMRWPGGGVVDMGLGYNMGVFWVIHLLHERLQTKTSLDFERWSENVCFQGGNIVNGVRIIVLLYMV
jgi:hypothetical protein